ncbi:LysR family transcriptional regulator [Rhizobium oryzicola]|uniref:LysR family transcriptional regulator n=1 Tax=Rhizobium oryzicola TaxID=1232668 RepID=A0ABT8T3Z3_9HYPH|nr:LysR family transcriptional regulator [Rhizobium oryzicola]MDO1585437.1 LysR family transcriptional regulator [Rhizobium oryzicola]
MQRPDFNLLITLDVLLAECNVARAARRLQLSPSAMSRALARLRETTGDPLLVRAGRGLVPTPRALELRDRVNTLVQDVEAVLRPAEMLDLHNLVRTFTFRNREGFVETFGAAVLARIAQDAPGVRIRFMPKPSKESAPLRNGEIDLETGVVGDGVGAEVKAQALFRDRFVGVVRMGHRFSGSQPTPSEFCAGRHILIARRESHTGPLDTAMAAVGLARDVGTVVTSFSEALALARNSDMIACVPERYTGELRAGMYSFDLPFETQEITISLLWHPRFDADPAHRWLRQCIRDVCGETRRPR